MYYLTTLFQLYNDKQCYNFNVEEHMWKEEEGLF
jgi:hypothetical protein